MKLLFYTVKYFFILWALYAGLSMSFWFLNQSSDFSVLAGSLTFLLTLGGIFVSVKNDLDKINKKLNKNEN